MHRLGVLILGLLALTMTTGLVVAAPASPMVPHGVDLASVHTDPPPLGLDTCAAEPPDDFSDPDDPETIGWYDGVWYNEPIDVDQDEGLTDEELELVIARTKARWEALRCLPFLEDVNVSVIDRETFQEEQGGSNISTDTRLFDNAQAKALFLVDENEDSIEVAEANRGAAVLGYYSITDEEIVLVSAADDTLYVDESTLAHELGHALQHQHFGFDDFGRNTTDARMAELGLIEGDVVFVQRVYEGHCEVGEWADDCLEPPDRPSGDLANIGLYLISFQPYSDGPNFAAHHYEEGGWDAVDGIYDSYPASAKEIMYPAMYGEFELQPPNLEDRSSDEWRLLERSHGPTWDQLGEPALFTAFMFPAFETQGAVTIVEPEGFFNYAEDGNLDPLNPYNYAHRFTDGWTGDRFKAYAETDAEDPALAYTLAVAFEDDAEARAFVMGYRQLLDYRGAEAHPDLTAPGEDGRLVVIDEDNSFSGAYWFVQNDNGVLIVFAPTVDDLEAVHADVSFEEVEQTPTPTPPDDPTPTPATPVDPTPTPTPDGQPGFGLFVAVLAIAGLTFLALRVRSRR